ncbi:MULTISPECIES: hypothetical protein [unclassified Methylobacterium]|jgi:hypothetical protein|uniref:hypothetical protein n=1 Tax=unclassified Methylobacterium TaxID=2615210 RepID=UPI001355C9F7|nr:hypothetical protein [Methylobacterium sp. 2A]MWV22688.1 hypothetical protein [Methylobacterium sp. 2A]
MTLRTGCLLAVVTAAGLVAGSSLRAEAAELGFLEMLFGARPAPVSQQVQPAPSYAPQVARHASPRLGSARRRLQTRFAALPVKIRVKEADISPRQIPIDMKAGATAALLKDETLRPGDIVVLNSGAKVFTGDPDKRHALRDFEPTQTSRFVSKGTRKVLAGLFTPVGAHPAQEARRMMARTSTPIPPLATPIPTEKTAMRVINPWRDGQ